MFVFRRDPDADLGVGVAFTSAAVDLGDRQGEASRAEAAARVSEAIGVPLALVTQVHGAEVLTVSTRPRGALLDLTVERADALATTVRGIAVAVRVADCLPICLAAADGSAIAAVHAGRRGLIEGVIEAAVGRLRTLTDAPLLGWVGPHVCASCYEVPPDMAAEASLRLGIPVARTRAGTTSIALGEAAMLQLRAVGVQTRVVGACTQEGADLHSYRRDADAAGRMVGLVWIGDGRAAPDVTVSAR